MRRLASSWRCSLAASSCRPAAAMATRLDQRNPHSRRDGELKEHRLRPGHRRTDRRPQRRRLRPGHTRELTVKDLAPAAVAEVEGLAASSATAVDLDSSCAHHAKGHKTTPVVPASRQTVDRHGRLPDGERSSPGYGASDRSGSRCARPHRDGRRDERLRTGARTTRASPPRRDGRARIRGASGRNRAPHIDRRPLERPRLAGSGGRIDPGRAHTDLPPGARGLCSRAIAAERFGVPLVETAGEVCPVPTRSPRCAEQAHKAVARTRRRSRVGARPHRVDRCVQ